MRKKFYLSGQEPLDGAVCLDKEWHQGLSISSKGIIEKSGINLRLIMLNDERLVEIRYDRFNKKDITECEEFANERDNRTGKTTPFALNYGVQGHYKLSKGFYITAELSNANTLSNADGIGNPRGFTFFCWCLLDFRQERGMVIDEVALLCKEQGGR